MIIRCRTVKTVCVKYPAPAVHCMRLLRVFPPAQRGGQTVESLDWKCTPRESTFGMRADDFGNEVLALAHSKIAKRFQFEMELITARESTFTDVPLETNLPENRLNAFLMPSALVDFNGVLLPMARALQGQPVAEICAAVHELLRYEPGKTFVDTPASAALEQGSGVCQDLAHLMIAFCRALKIPARYVAGYSPTEGAMHAWVEVLEDDVWKAWDPTHNRRTAPEFVYVASGRDFRDVAPLTGTYQGAPGANLEVRCETKVLLS
jgi:transglutaminase-like putative cysteine protease